MKILYLSVLIASIIFLFIDIIWLSFATKSFYRPNIGSLLLDKPIFWAAALFYIIYIIGIGIVVIQPSIEADSIIKSIYLGFVFGLVAYGTYNLTNMAILKDWSAKVTFVDMFWGGCLTSFSSFAGIYFAKKFLT